MQMLGGLVLTLCLHHMSYSAAAQDCASNKELLKSLRQTQKLLTVLLNNTKTAATCPRLAPPPHGRRLGRVFSVSHEVHFLCKPGYDLIGPRTRVCLTTRKWSGQQPMCRRLNNTSTSKPKSAPVFKPTTLPTLTTPTSPLTTPTSPPSSSSSSVRASHCSHFLGSTRCTCDVGFTISGRDNNICTDIDECHLYPLSQPGRLCVHECVNQPGSFHCLCPHGYRRHRDTRSCTDIDECESRSHNCKGEQQCVNTYGGFECVTASCPHVNNATYIKTSPMRCERNPCMSGDQSCSLSPSSISFHFLSVVSKMAAPRVLFRVSAARSLGDTLRFGLAGSGKGRGFFSVQRSGRQTGTLLLVSPITGPATLEAEVEMSELERNTLLGRYLTKVTLFVSPYTF